MRIRLEYIDCLRGVAIGGVVLVHSGQIVTGLPGWLHSLADYGGRGVELFFVLSALTLVSVSAGRPFYAGPFFIRRFFRLFPMFYIGVFLYLLINGTGPSINAPNGIGLHQVVLTLLFVHGWVFDSINSVVPGGWSIADEAMFYLSFPLLLAYMNTGRRTACMLFIAIMISRLSFVLIPRIFAGATTPELLQIFTAFCFPTQCPAFICGFAVFFLKRWIDGHPEKTYFRGNYARAALFAGSAAILLCAASNNKTLTNYLLGDMMFVVFVTAVYLTQTRILVNGVMRHIGLVSYSIYIVHFAFIDLFKLYVVPALGGFSPALQLMMVYPAVLMLATLVASATYRFIELPTIELGRKLSQRAMPAAAQNA